MNRDSKALLDGQVMNRDSKALLERASAEGFKQRAERLATEQQVTSPPNE